MPDPRTHVATVEVTDEIRVMRGTLRRQLNQYLNNPSVFSYDLVLHGMAAYWKAVGGEDGSMGMGLDSGSGEGDGVEQPDTPRQPLFGAEFRQQH